MSVKDEVLKVLSHASVPLRIADIRKVMASNGVTVETRSSVRHALIRMQIELTTTCQSVNGRRTWWSIKGHTPSTKIQVQNQGDLIMQIEQGVADIVHEMTTAGKTFSAHDITKELRDRVNAGTIQVDPGLAGTAHVNGKDVTKIEHSFVKDAVHQLMTSGKYDYDRTHNGTFFEYAPAVAAPDPTSGPAPAPVSGSSYNGGSTL